MDKSNENKGIDYAESASRIIQQAILLREQDLSEKELWMFRQSLKIQLEFWILRIQEWQEKNAATNIRRRNKKQTQKQST